MRISSRVLSALFVGGWLMIGALATCPPPGFDSVPDFDLEAYTAAPWYPQQQVPVAYQRREQLYCVKAEYRIINPNNLSEGIEVNNYANQGAVNGPSLGTNATFAMIAVPASDLDLSSSMRARLRIPGVTTGGSKSSDATAASKLVVGPKTALPAALQKRLEATRLFGPYWVVAVGPSTNATLKYDWAIVSGGAPVHQTSTRLCSTFSPLLPSTMQYRGGLWLFTRSPVDEVSAQAAKIKAEELGIDTYGLLSVEQKGCKYQ